MGGYRLPIGGQRRVHKKERLRQPCPSQKAKGAPCPARSGAPTTQNRKSAPRSSMCSRSKRTGWICSFAPSALREREQSRLIEASTLLYFRSALSTRPSRSARRAIG